MAKKKSARRATKAKPSKLRKGTGSGGKVNDGDASPAMDSAARNFPATGEPPKSPNLAPLTEIKQATSAIEFFGPELESLRRTGYFSTLADVDEIFYSVMRGINKLKRIQGSAADSDVMIAAGRALANITARFLDSWPKDATVSVTKEFIELKRMSVGFAQRWDETHTSGRPKQQGFAKGKQKERSDNDEHISNYIWNVQYFANAVWNEVLCRFLSSRQNQIKPLDERGERLIAFMQLVALRLSPAQKAVESFVDFREFMVRHSVQSNPDYWIDHLKKKFADNYHSAEHWLHHAINDHFEDYWRIVIEPLLNKRAWDVWARSRSFERPVTAKEKGMTKSEFAKLPTWKPSFSIAKRTMKPILQEIMQPSPLIVADTWGC